MEVSEIISRKIEWKKSEYGDFQHCFNFMVKTVENNEIAPYDDVRRHKYFAYPGAIIPVNNIINRKYHK